MNNETESSQQRSEQKKRADLLAAERLAWWKLRAVYERCIAIAEQVWEERLDTAQCVQQNLAEEMRDRTRTQSADTGLPSERQPLYRASVEIPVPLFTPRDRQQFIKEVATTLLIEANRRGLNATPEPKPEQETAPEAASGTDEASVDAEQVGLAEAGEILQVNQS